MTVTAVNIIGGGDPANRKERDFYPTPPDVTHALMRFLKDEGLTPKRVWECACGDYAMLRVIEQYTFVIGTDITGGYDFLKTAPPVADIDAIITNPPFNLSEKFIKRAMFHEVPLVAMLLKSQYWHAARRMKLFNHHRPSFILPLTWRPDFDGRGAPTMDMLWTVWIKGTRTTAYCPLAQTQHDSKQLTLFED